MKNGLKGNFLFFLARVGQNHQRQKRGARVKLVGVEEVKIEGVTSILNSEFFRLQRRTSDVEFRP